MGHMSNFDIFVSKKLQIGFGLLCVKKVIYDFSDVTSEFIWSKVGTDWKLLIQCI